jgi:hypothetical protein
MACDHRKVKLFKSPEQLETVTNQQDANQAGMALPALCGSNSGDDSYPASNDSGKGSFHRYFDDDPLVEDKTYPGAIYSACHAENDEDDPELPYWLEPIEHLSEYLIDPTTNLPVWTFFVHAGDDGTLRYN